MWLLLALGAFALTVAGHAVLCRLPLRTDFVVKSVLVGLPVGVLLAAVMVSRHGLVIGTAAALLLYAFLFELYVFCFTLVSTSVSVSILLKLARRQMTAGEIDTQYSSESMVEGRFAKLLRANFLARKDNGYCVTPKARLILAVFRTIRFFFRHPSASQ